MKWFGGWWGQEGIGYDEDGTWRRYTVILFCHYYFMHQDSPFLSCFCDEDKKGNEKDEWIILCKKRNEAWKNCVLQGIGHKRIRYDEDGTWRRYAKIIFFHYYFMHRDSPFCLVFVVELGGRGEWWGRWRRGIREVIPLLSLYYLHTFIETHLFVSFLSLVVTKEMM